ncbi:MAG: hypothetical protein NT170_02860 [Candidatus Moranbacteria bacterium]|nr:hypothetical protein [Candidatus Moranbacteria bacterium]
MNVEELKNNLRAVGIPENNLNEVAKDLYELILQRIMAAYLNGLDEGQKDKLRGLSGEEITKYIKDHKEEYPAMNKENVAKISQETLEEYLREMKK